MVDVRQLRYFVTIVDKRSFTKASEVLGITQPSLGFQIKKIEDELQIKVLFRNSRGVQLTELGQILYERGKRIIADVEDLQRCLADQSGEPRGPVSLGITPSLADRILVPLIKRVRAELPLIDLNVTEDMSQHLIDLLEIGKIDIALVFGVLSGRGMIVRRLAEDAVYLLYRATDGAADYSPIAFRDLSNYPLILPRRPHRLRQLVDETAHDCNVELDIIAEMQSLASILRMVDNGLGATMMSSTMSHRKSSDGTLVSRPIIGPQLIHDISIVHLDTKTLTRGAQAINMMIDEMVQSNFS